MVTLSQTVDAYVGLGSNLEDPIAQVQRAMESIAALEGVELVASSALYRSAAVGPGIQPEYINAAVRIRVSMTAHELLAVLLDLERRLGRVRDGVRWGPRTIDIDVLIYGREHLASEQLTLPHPHIADRPFVLVPLADVAESTLEVPGFGALADLLAVTDRSQVTRVDYNQG